MAWSAPVPHGNGLDAHCAGLYERALAAGQKLTLALDAEIALLDASECESETDLAEWQKTCRAVAAAALEYAERVRAFRFAIEARYSINGFMRQTSW